MSYIFDPAPVPTLAVADSQDRIPVRRIFCIGRNYAAHAVEMGKDPDRDPPRRSSSSSPMTRWSRTARPCLTRPRPSTSTTRPNWSR